MVTTLHHLTQQMYSAGMHIEGKELYYMGTDFLVRKLDVLKVEKHKEIAKLQKMNEKTEFLTFLTYSYHYNAKREEGSY